MHHSRRLESVLPYISLYRKYRSQTFSDLIGQNTSFGPFRTGSRRANAHAYLFTGPRGTAKRPRRASWRRRYAARKARLPNRATNAPSVRPSPREVASTFTRWTRRAKPASTKSARRSFRRLNTSRPPVATRCSLSTRSTTFRQRHSTPCSKLSKNRPSTSSSF